MENKIDTYEIPVDSSSEYRALDQRSEEEPEEILGEDDDESDEVNTLFKLSINN